MVFHCVYMTMDQHRYPFRKFITERRKEIILKLPINEEISIILEEQYIPKLAPLIPPPLYPISSQVLCVFSIIPHICPFLSITTSHPQFRPLLSHTWATIITSNWLHSWPPSASQILLANSCQMNFLKTPLWSYLLRNLFRLSITFPIKFKLLTSAVPVQSQLPLHLYFLLLFQRNPSSNWSS